MRALPQLMALAISLITLTLPSQTLAETNHQAYNNKMTLLQVLLDGAKVPLIKAWEEIRRGPTPARRCARTDRDSPR